MIWIQVDFPSGSSVISIYFGIRHSINVCVGTNNLTHAQLDVKCSLKISMYDSDIKGLD